MVNPLLTIIFDIFLIGSAVAVSAGMVAEYLATRELHIGTTRRVSRAARPSQPQARVTRVGTARRRAA